MTLGQFIRARSILLPLLLLISGCAVSPSVSPKRLIASQAMLDFEGLSPTRLQPKLKVYAALPASWTRLPTKVSGPIIHQQWRSPSHQTAVGIGYIRLPFPVSAKFLIWLAKMQYADDANKAGKSADVAIKEWTDPTGREWFDAKTDKYHLQGYAITDGFDAWIVYSGYKRGIGVNWPELALATRSMKSVLPVPLAPGR